MQPQSETVSEEIWGRLLDLCSFHRYLLKLETRYNSRKTFLRIATYFLSSGVVGSFFGGLDEKTTMGLALVITGIVIFEHVMNYSGKAAKHHHARLGIANLEDKYRELWLDVRRTTSTISPDEAMERSREIMREAQQYYSLIEKLDEKVSEKCLKETYKVESERYV